MKAKFTAKWTGLIDKNGKKICRGDWVTHPICVEGKVIWFQPYCSFKIENNELLYDLKEEMDIEIIERRLK